MFRKPLVYSFVATLALFLITGAVFSGVINIDSARLAAATMMGDGGIAGTKNIAAVGNFDGLHVGPNNKPALYGWAYDPNDKSKSIEVHFYVDGPTGTGKYVGKVTANLPSPDLQPAVPGQHRFSFDIPNEYLGGTRPWYVYAIDLQGPPNPAISGSGKNITTSAPPPPPPPPPTTTEYKYPEGFSSTQGTGQWTYQYGTGGSYTNMTWDAANNLWKGNENYLTIKDKGMHPGNSTDVVLTWTAPQAGTVKITSTVRDRHAACGDGVNTSILHGTKKIWDATIENGDTVGVSNSSNVTVAKNDKVHFIVNKLTNYSCDTTAATHAISYVATPPTPAPTCSLSVTPTSIEKGQSANLSWTTTNASSMTIDQGVGSVTPVASGSKSISPTTATTYTGTVVGSGGTATCSTSINVTQTSGQNIIEVGPAVTVVQNSEINHAKGTYGGRYVDASPTTVTKGNERYWYNTNSFYWTKYKGTLDKPFATKLWSKPVGEVFNVAPFPDPPNGERARYWLMNSYQDADENILGFIHVEWASIVNGVWHTNKGRIGLAWSTDGGDSFTYLGDIVVPSGDPAEVNMAGVPYFMKAGYFYVYFIDRCPNPATAVARAPIADVVAAAKNGTVSEWKKYYNSAWNSSANGGGLCTGLLPTEEGIVHSDASYSTFTEKSYLLLSRGNRDVSNNLQTSFLKMYESTDGVNWTFAKTIAEEEGSKVEYGYAYSTIVDETGKNNGRVGSKFYVYSDRDAARGGPNGVIKRWLVNLDGSPTPPPPPPPPPAKPKQPSVTDGFGAAAYSAFQFIIDRLF